MRGFWVKSKRRGNVGGDFWSFFGALRREYEPGSLVIQSPETEQVGKPTVIFRKL